MLITNKPISGRSCGDCKACCSSLQVIEIDKPLWSGCQNLCETGCGIYPDRPTSCQEFECLWLSGNLEGDERRRPDNLGLMFSIQTAQKIPYPTIGCFEVKPGAVKAQSYLLRKIAAKYIVWIWPFQEPTRRKVIGPREWLANLQLSEASLDDEKSYSRIT